MSASIEHLMLVANAGSGKTYQLTTRMVRLLALGVDPSRIAALTFTRKAAGEFLDSVFLRLASAASDDGALERLRSDTGLDGLDAPACGVLLEKLVDGLGRLCMGTIDSLFVRIARVFPLESGLSGEFTLLGTAALEAAREEALAALFRHYAADSEGFDELVDLVRQQNRRQGERDVFDGLLGEIGRFHELYLRTPPGESWGDRAAVWPDGCAVLDARAIGPAAEALREAIRGEQPVLPPEVAGVWDEQLAKIGRLKSIEGADPELKKFIDAKLCGCKRDPKTGDEYVPMGTGKARRLLLTAGVRTAREGLLRALLRPEFEALLRRSRALYLLMARFEELYAARTRRAGRMTFADLTDLLAGQVDEPQWRATVGYRLDTRFDHWLLDEFQDTSRTQWKVLSAFIDEVVQDAGGDRSLFYVGDTKQAIYGWRGGAPELFFEIRDRYNRGSEERIRADSLVRSFRSTPEIVEAVNRVFGGLDAWAEPLGLPQRVVTEWRRAWREHEANPRTDGRTGYVSWVSVGEEEPAADGQTGEDELDPQDAVVLAVLERVEPWRRGLTCAVLRRDNRSAGRVAALLQSRGIPVALEGRMNPCTDNPLGVALLLAFRCAATPADSLARELLAASPLGPALLADGPLRFRQRALQSVARDGYAATVRRWIEGVSLDDEPFLADRASAFVAAAAAFDVMRAPGDGLHAFIDHIERFETQEAESRDVVRVMTVHQSKGLTFDVCIVSGLDAPVHDRTHGELFLDTSRRPAAGILLPRKAYAATDPVLSAARDALQAEAVYGELCTAYVALTRPRFGLYLVSRKLGDRSTAKGFGRLLQLTLGPDSFERGDPRWFEQHPLVADPAAEPREEGRLVLPPPLAGTPRPRFPSAHSGLAGADRQESAEDAGTEAAGTSHDVKRGAGRSDDPWEGDAARVGIEVHAALATVECLGDSKWPAGLSAEARSMVERFLGSAKALEVLARPVGPCRLWRERAFDVMLNGEWVSGVFDRVLIRLDPSGRYPVAAEVYDFKTDRLDPAEIAERYAAQMADYRLAAAALLGLDPSAVSASTVAVRVGLDESGTPAAGAVPFSRGTDS